MQIPDNVLLLLLYVLLFILVLRQQSRVTRLRDTMISLTGLNEEMHEVHRDLHGGHKDRQDLHMKRIEYLEDGLNDMQRILNHNCSVFAHVLGIPMDGPPTVKKEEKPKLRLVKNE